MAVAEPDNSYEPRQPVRYEEGRDYSYTEDESRAGEIGMFGEDGFGFDDLLDIINPLQHLPVISHFYREWTGDTIGDFPRLAGGALFGGPLGFAGSFANLLIEKQSGDDVAGHVMTALFGGDESSPSMQVPDNMAALPADARGHAAGARGAFPVNALEGRISATSSGPIRTGLDMPTAATDMDLAYVESWSPVAAKPPSRADQVVLARSQAAPDGAARMSRETPLPSPVQAVERVSSTSSRYEGPEAIRQQAGAIAGQVSKDPDAAAIQTAQVVRHRTFPQDKRERSPRGFSVAPGQNLSDRVRRSPARSIQPPAEAAKTDTEAAPASGPSLRDRYRVAPGQVQDASGAARAGSKAPAAAFETNPDLQASPARPWFSRSASGYEAAPAAAVGGASGRGKAAAGENSVETPDVIDNAYVERMLLRQQGRNDGQNSSDSSRNNRQAAGGIASGQVRGQSRAAPAERTPGQPVPLWSSNGENAARARQAYGTAVQPESTNPAGSRTAPAATDATSRAGAPRMTAAQRNLYQSRGAETGEAVISPTAPTGQTAPAPENFMQLMEQNWQKYRNDGGR